MRETCPSFLVYCGICATISDLGIWPVRKLFHGWCWLEDLRHCSSRKSRSASIRGKSSWLVEAASFNLLKCLKIADRLIRNHCLHLILAIPSPHLRGYSTSCIRTILYLTFRCGLWNHRLLLSPSLSLFHLHPLFLNNRIFNTGWSLVSLFEYFHQCFRLLFFLRVRLLLLLLCYRAGRRYSLEFSISYDFLLYMKVSLSFLIGILNHHDAPRSHSSSLDIDMSLVDVVKEWCDLENIISIFEESMLMLNSENALFIEYFLLWVFNDENTGICWVNWLFINLLNCCCWWLSTEFSSGHPS